MDGGSAQRKAPINTTNREYNNEKVIQVAFDRAIPIFERSNAVDIIVSTNFLSLRHIFDNYHTYTITIKDHKFLMNNIVTLN
jgi:SAM-dependent MidA family methyltransferase